ncbi:MAG: polymerase, sigma-24 subunit, subfamily [Edaphobacter sp.]|nr:polymerase, sigma-24 subunit, subfamily [Edaphobacter sp.]
MMRMMFQRVGRNSKNEAFGIEYMDALYGYALMLTRNNVEAEDLVQETYVRALKAQHRLREDSNMEMARRVVLIFYQDIRATHRRFSSARKTQNRSRSRLPTLGRIPRGDYVARV